MAHQAPAESLAPLLRLSLNGFAALTRDGVYVYVSESLCALLQLSKDALLRCVCCGRPALRRRALCARALDERPRACSCLPAAPTQAAHGRLSGAQAPTGS